MSGQMLDWSTASLISPLLLGYTLDVRKLNCSIYRRVCLEPFPRRRSNWAGRSVILYAEALARDVDTDVSKSGSEYSSYSKHSLRL